MRSPSIIFRIGSKRAEFQLAIALNWEVLAGEVVCAVADVDILGCGVEIANSRGNNAAIALL